MTDPELIVVTTTSDQRETLDKIAARLVEENLAACCQIGGPVTSWYSWEGKIAQEDEWTCTIKSIQPRYRQVEQVILELHHYDQPQVVAVPVIACEAGYGDWVKQQCRDSGPEL